MLIHAFVHVFVPSYIVILDVNLCSGPDRLLCLPAFFLLSMVYRFATEPDGGGHGMRNERENEERDERRDKNPRRNGLTKTFQRNQGEMENRHERLSNNSIEFHQFQEIC